MTQGILTYTRADHTDPRSIRRDNLVKLQHDLQLLNSNIDSESNGASIAQISEILSKVIDILIGEKYYP